jgi:hypothetical protein
MIKYMVAFIKGKMNKPALSLIKAKAGLLDSPMSE